MITTELLSKGSLFAKANSNARILKEMLPDDNCFPNTEFKDPKAEKRGQVPFSSALTESEESPTDPLQSPTLRQ